ncbi:MAG: hypothetical protein GAKPKEKM_01462 [Rhodocyclaceae bacterium]|jgi:hypothetical protein|nr:hypothetical protein [Rhodocyclaceae bacterium]
MSGACAARTSPLPAGAEAGFREACFALLKPAGCVKPAVGRAAGAGGEGNT